jgi:hypothetical protein
MNEPPTQEQWDEAFSASHELEPTPKCWGIFVYSDAPPPVCGSGLGSFHWFRTENELTSFIREYLAWWTPAPSSMEPEEIAAEVQAIVDADSDTLPTMVDRLNEFMRNMWHIEWCGRFQDLCVGSGEFPTKIRDSFLEVSDVAETATLPRNMIADFKEYLRTYGL